MKGSDSSLRKKLDKGMKSLRDTNRFIATTKKLSTVIDCASSYPKVKGKSNSEHSIKQSHVATGFINGIDNFPSIHGVIKARNDVVYQIFTKNIFRQCYDAH